MRFKGWLHSGVVQIDFPDIRLTLSDSISELRGTYQKVSPEMDVSRRVEYHSTQDLCLTPSEKKVTSVSRRQQNRKFPRFQPSSTG